MSYIGSAGSTVVTASSLRLLASYTVAGAAKQTINFGPGGDAYTTGTLPTGYRYGIRARVKPTTVANTHLFDLRPNSLTTNMFSQYVSLNGASVSAGKTTDGIFAGVSADVEEYHFNIEWDELAGFDRLFEIVTTTYDDSGTVVDSVRTDRLIWAQTPAETALANMVLGCDQATGFGIGSYLTLLGLGAI